MFLWTCCRKTNDTVVPTNESIIEYYSHIQNNEPSFVENQTLDEENAKKFGITVKRYRTIMQTHGMNLEMMNYLHENEWDFKNTSQDIHLIAFSNNPEQKYPHIQGSIIF